MVVLHPMDTKFKNTNFVLRCICILSILTFLLSVVSTLTLRFYSHQVPFKLCSPFVDPTNSVVLFQVTIWGMVFLQAMSISFIVVVYGKLVKAMETSMEILKGQVSKQHSQRAIIVQLVTVTLTNVLCWVPSSAVHLTSLLLKKYPIDMVIWTTIIVMPFNSIVNPIVFTVASRRSHNA